MYEKKTQYKYFNNQYSACDAIKYKKIVEANFNGVLIFH